MVDWYSGISVREDGIRDTMVDLIIMGINGAMLGFCGRCHHVVQNKIGSFFGS